MRPRRTDKGTEGERTETGKRTSVKEKLLYVIEAGVGGNKNSESNQSHRKLGDEDKGMATSLAFDLIGCCIHIDRPQTNSVHVHNSSQQSPETTTTTTSDKEKQKQEYNTSPNIERLGLCLVCLLAFCARVCAWRERACLGVSSSCPPSSGTSLVVATVTHTKFGLGPTSTHAPLSSSLQCCLLSVCLCSVSKWAAAS